jgi:small subunit ribosomal protein S12
MTKNQIKRIKKNIIIKRRERIEKEKRKKKEIVYGIKGKPQIKGITVKIYTLTPKKPNSALRKVAKVKINITKESKKKRSGREELGVEEKNKNIKSNGIIKTTTENNLKGGNIEEIKGGKMQGTKIIIAYIPEEKHTLTVHNMVLIRPGKTKDLPGVRYKIIRGVLDCK